MIFMVWGDFVRDVDQASAVLEQIDAITGEDGSRGSPQKAEGILVVDS